MQLLKSRSRCIFYLMFDTGGSGDSAPRLQPASQVSAPYAPKLVAADTNAPGEPYETTRNRLKTVLGQPAPYRFPTLRDRNVTAARRPGARRRWRRPAM